MFKIKIKVLSFFASLFIIFVAEASARDLVVSLPLLPPLVESKDKGIFIDLIGAMDRAYKGGAILIKGPFPFIRSLSNVHDGQADFHMPILFNPLIPEDKLEFSHSTVTIFKVDFALYTNENNMEINPDNLSKFKIETDRAHTQFFDFDIVGSSSIESSLKKVALNRIDAFVFAMTTTDIVLKGLELKNIKRWYFNTFDVRIVLPKNQEKKAEIDGILSKVIADLKSTGEYQKIMGPILWQRFAETEFRP